VQEDVIDILLNLKKVALRMHNRNEATVTLNKKGPVRSWRATSA
jgi:DNA-directed RNA polymerase subunit alpha